MKGSIYPGMDTGLAKMRNNNFYKLAAITVVVTTVSGGCRSAGGWNPLARRSEPSAEMLAGAGPTATYPKPSSLATPEAIASIAGGTAAPSGPANRGTQVAGVSPAATQVPGVDVTPGYAAPAGGGTNYAAANANGVYNQPVGYKTPTAAATSPGAGKPATPPSSYANLGSSTRGYQFGSKSDTAKASLSDTTASMGDQKPLPGAPVKAASGHVAAATKAAADWMPPAFGQTGNAAPTGAASPKASTAGAFAMPPMGTTAGSAPAKTASSSFGIPPIGATAPSPAPASTASAFAMPGTAAAKVADATTSVRPAAAKPTAGSGYLPGSTQSMSGGYPGTRTAAPSSTGSFYR